MSVHLFNIPENEWSTIIVNAIADLYNALFPDRIRAIYISGSRTEKSAASISDIDGYILFKDAFMDEAEEKLAQTVLSQCRLISPLRLDIELWAEDNPRVYQSPDVRLKLGSHLVYGEDIRDKIPLPTIDAYQEHMRKWVRGFLINLHDLDALRSSLAYPDADDEFFGYTRKRALRWYPPEVDSGTKELVATICWTATALLAFEAELFISTRSECIQACREHLSPQWADFVELAYTQCKHTWDYKVPSLLEDRRCLAGLCKQSLEFFNEYIEKYDLTTTADLDRSG